MRDQGPSDATSHSYDYVGRLHNEFLGLLQRTAVEVDRSKDARDVDTNDLLSSFLEESEIEVGDTRLELSWSEFGKAVKKGIKAVLGKIKSLF